MKIKVFYIIDKLAPGKGGSATSLVELVCGLNKNTFDIAVCALCGDDHGSQHIDALKNFGIKTYFLKLRRIYNLKAFFALFRLINLIKEEQADIVHTYLFSSTIFGTLAAILTHVPVIISKREMESWKEWHHIFASKCVNHFCKKIITPSQAIMTLAIRQEQIVPHKIKTIYNGVNLHFFSGNSNSTEIKEKLNINRDIFVVGNIGNLIPIKGQRYLLEAAASVIKEIPNVIFLIIGDGYLRKSLEDYAKKLYIQDKIIFTGRQLNVRDYLQIMDIFVNSSLSEGFSNAILEAMAMNKPIIATNAGGNSESVVDGENGILVPPKDSLSLTSAIITLLRDKELVKRMGSTSRALVERKFSSKIMVTEFEKTYLELVSKNKIAYVLSQFPETHETFILREFEALKKKGVDFRIFSLKRCKDKVVHSEARELLGQTIYGKAFSYQLSAISFQHPIRTLRAFIYVIKSNFKQPKELVKAFYVFLESFYFAQIIKREKITHIHSHWATMPTTAAAILSKLTGRPFSFTAHAWDIFVNSNGLANKIREAKFVVTCTEYNRQYLSQLATRSASRHKIYRNYHGIDLDAFANKRSYHSSAFGSQLKILAIGRLVETKGFEYLTDACRILNERGIDFECNIIGIGPLENRLKLSAISHQLSDKVNFLGIKTQGEIKRLYSEATVLVQPSVIAKNGDRDGIPNVIIEAIALGVPVIATEISGIPEAVIDGKTGILIPAKDSYALANAIEKLWKDFSLRGTFVINARNLAEDKFDIGKNTTELINIFQENGILN